MENKCDAAKMKVVDSILVIVEKGTLTRPTKATTQTACQLQQGNDVACSYGPLQRPFHTSLHSVLMLLFVGFWKERTTLAECGASKVAHCQIAGLPAAAAAVAAVIVDGNALVEASAWQRPVAAAVAFAGANEVVVELDSP